MALNFEQDLQINKHALDAELLDQAQRMFRYSSAHAQAMLNRDKAKQSLDITKANLDASIRVELTTAGTKFTEAVVDGKIRMSPGYIESQDKYQKAEHEVQLLLGAVMAMNARRSMLENLVKLFLGQYWSEPRLEGRGLAPDIAQNATERAIMQSQDFELPKDFKVPQNFGLPEVKETPPMPLVQPPMSPPPTPAVIKTEAGPGMPSSLMYAIGQEDVIDGFSHGPFPDLRMALDIDGQPYDVIYELNRLDHNYHKIIRWWHPVTKTWTESKYPSPAPGIPKPPSPMRPVPRTK